MEEVLVLGPIEARLAGASVDLGTPKQRALVCALALSVGRPVAVDTIVDLLWGDDPPPGVAGTLQSYVSGLRRVLEPQRERRRPAEVLVTVAPGYALRVEPGATDAGRFVAMVGARHRALAGAPLTGRTRLDRATLTETVESLDEALGLWRGRPYAELDDAPDAAAERARLDDLRLVALEDRAVAALALGHHATVAAELEALTAAHPLRERMWGLRAVALARSGRQADALEALSAVRNVLADELGLEPGIELRELQGAILRQDPALAWVEPAAAEQAVEEAARMVARPVEGAAGAERAEPSAVTTLVGRADELAVLVGRLEEARSGAASYVALVGEPGIGKSRLADELVRLARAQGWTVATGRCSPDDGAPPLWPWAAALADLGGTLSEETTAEAGDPGARFRAWERIARRVRELASADPVLLVVEDLQWADASSLGALRVLVESMDRERLLVLTTRRSHPEPTGLLADLAETAARRHGVRLDLTGLDLLDAARLAEQVAGNRPSRSESEALRARTEGNPFFVVEFARLAGRRGDLGRLLNEGNPPTAVTDVVGRRIDRLPADTVGVLRTAAVIGRDFDLTTLARSAGIDEDDVLDIIDPAQAAGLLVEDAFDRFTFAHALVVDTLLAGLRPSRRGRVHARVAEALADGAGRETELARHWLAAGPAYAAQAWRAAVAAAAQSARLHDHERATELLRAAEALQEKDDSAGPRDRYDLLLDLIDGYRWSAHWPELVGCVEQAVAVARQIGDVELVARAAISTNQGALWQSAPYGEVHEGVVGALRDSLAGLPPGDGPLRCRVLLGLANELYYIASYDERRELVDEAIAMAERLHDDRLLVEARQGSWMALWCRRNTEEAFERITAARDVARRLGDERSSVVSSCLRCVALNELGRPAEMFAEIESARLEAERLRIPYGLIVLDGLYLSWLVLAGRFEECDQVLERIERLDEQMSLEHSGDAKATAYLSLMRWQGRDGELAAVLESVADGPFPVSASVAAAMWRAGDHERAAEYAAAHPAQLDHDDWFSVFAWAAAAELALYLGDADLGQRVGELMKPYAGESVSAGSVLASGPVDLFLALAVRATGDADAATQHADRAAELCKAWEIPLVAEWLDRLRAQYAF
ncbi:BTAD domain-containing putative transcriptional regulator [Marmoricola sp. URHA0025 HA25]